MTSNDGKRIRYTKFEFCVRCKETAAFLAGTPTSDGLNEIRTCDNDCGQQITTPVMVYTTPGNATHHFDD